LLPETEQEESIAVMQPAFKMGETEFADFRHSVIAPMIVRHHEMFPNMPRLDSRRKALLPREEKSLGTGRNAPCPCNSGKKFKRCCGR
jgi:hypothetical protein